MNEVTKAPVPFASITIDKTTLGTSSNEQGFFILIIPAAPGPWNITVTSLGFATARITDFPDSLIVMLRPSTIELKEVVISAKDQNAKRIVLKAFSRIKKNYETKTFVYKSFYRHYCRDDTTYGRLIEAAVDIYKRKGHKLIRPRPGYKEEVRVTQLRRSFDNTRLQLKNHQPISLYSVMGADPVSYQSKSDLSNDFINYLVYGVSGLKRQLKDYEFEFDGITTYDGQDVFRINYSRKLSTGSVVPFNFPEQGTLFIGTEDYAIIRSEFRSSRANRYRSDTIFSITTYKKLGKKYYHHHTIKEGSMLYEDSTEHTYTLELMTSDIVLENYPTFKGKEPDKEKLLSVNYDSTFWDTYNILKATPLQEKIASHLQQHSGLDYQFSEYLRNQREHYFSGKEDEENFNKHLLSMRGYRPVYVFAWATWCEPCIKNISRLKRLMEMYKTKISFVMISFDHDLEEWRRVCKKLDIDEGPIKNFRIGRNADAIASFSINELPRGILVDKAGNFVDLNAKKPSDFLLIKDFEDLLSGSDK